MKIVILSGYGLNCEDETSFAFLSAAKHLGADCQCDVMHITDLVQNPKLLKDAQIFVIPGGFSFSDYSGAGNALGVLLKNRLLDAINDFICNDKLVLGICNGCQVLVQLLDAFSGISLKKNSCGVYKCRWVHLKVSSPSPWLQNLTELHIPIAHGEGKFIFDNNFTPKVALSYIPKTKNTTTYNPNGSQLDAAAVTDTSGRILAMMPHPERALFFAQRPDWTLYQSKNDLMPTYGDGFKIFENAIRYFM